ncbi:MAG: hypothetical protein WD715_07985 [Dongiaceae bacterium]
MLDASELHAAMESSPECDVALRSHYTGCANPCRKNHAGPVAGVRPRRSGAREFGRAGRFPAGGAVSRLVALGQFETAARPAAGCGRGELLVAERRRLEWEQTHGLVTSEPAVERGDAAVTSRIATSGAPDLRLATKRDVSDYLRNGGSLECASVTVDPQHLDGATAELAALIAEARGHRVRPDPDALRFGTLRHDYAVLKRNAGAPRIGIVVNPRRRFQVSDRAALDGFVAAAERRGIRADLTRRATLGAIGRFDAYLIREDTIPVGGAVYRFVHAIERAGRTSIDDFRSLIRCGNKAYQAVLFGRIGIPIPKTQLWFREDRRIDATPLGYPLIVKRPDGAFSRDVHKCESERELLATGARLFRRSPVLVLQEFVASDFDWRIGVCDSKPIFAVMYRYPPGSWKIADYDRAGQPTFGRAEAVTLDAVPSPVVKAAVDAAAAIGAGLYGVDVKATANGVCVLEVNDNPDIDHGVEAALGPDRVYGTIIETLASRARVLPD